MSSLIVEVCEIEERIDLEECHSLDLYRVKGWYSISGKKQYEPGNLVVFIPPDSQLDQKFMDYFCTGKIKIKDGRVKSEKIRGVFSQGLLIDISDPKLNELYPGMEKKRLGDDVAKDLNITKWEPKTTKLSGAAQRRHPQLEKYTDIENIKNFNNMFEEGELVIITEKLHGTSWHGAKLPKAKLTLFEKVKKFLGFPVNEVLVSSRNVQLSPTGDNVYNRIANRLDLEKILEPGMILYGEIVGPEIQANYHYGLKPGGNRFLCI